MPNRRPCRGDLWYDIDTKLIYPDETSTISLGPYTFENATSSLWGVFWRTPLEPFEYPTESTVLSVIDRLQRSISLGRPALVLSMTQRHNVNGFFGTNPSHPQRLIKATRAASEEFAPGNWIFQAYRDGWAAVIPRIEAEFRLAGLGPMTEF